MPNVRLLRQSVEDYQNQLDSNNEDYQAAYDIYKEKATAYNTAQVAFSDAVNAASAKPTPSVYEVSKGTYKFVSNTIGNSGKKAPVFSDTKALSKSGVDAGFVYGANGTLDFWQLGSAGGSNVYKREGTYPGIAMPTVPSPGRSPDLVKPNEPNITASGVAELNNPGLDQAQAQLQQAMHGQAKTNLAGDTQPAMKGSAFTNPADPQGLKERGVLARVLGGQL